MQCSIPVLLQLYCADISLNDLVKMQILLKCVWGEDEDSAFLTSSHTFCIKALYYIKLLSYSTYAIIRLVQIFNPESFKKILATKKCF